MLGSKPSDLFPYWDVARFAELLVDGDDTVPTSSLIDSNAKAVQLVRAAEGIICQAVRFKNQYSLQQLRDLVRDGQKTTGIAGQQLLSLIADIVWCRTFGRKRYAADSPQGRDPACEDSQKYLDRLQNGARIFVLEGVEQTDGNGKVIGTYGADVPNAGVMEGGRLHSNIDCARHFWGNSNDSNSGPPWCDDGDAVRGGGGCC